MTSNPILKQLQNNSHRPLVMGILNITPDSFSDGGDYLSPAQALARANEMMASGADIIDIGGESTRPGAAAVAENEELDRVIPLIEAIRTEFDVPISVDTSKAAVMQAAVKAGANMINDVCALQAPGTLAVAVDAGVPVCLMHMQGTPRTMQSAPKYKNVTRDVIAFLRQRVNSCVTAGMKPDNIILDPGFGFGKTLEHNYTLLREFTEFKQLGFPLLAGLSRKSMIDGVLNLPVNQRQNASVVLAGIAAIKGAAVLRVHDVAKTVEAAKLIAAINQFGVEKS